MAAALSAMPGGPSPGPAGPPPGPSRLGPRVDFLHSAVDASRAHSSAPASLHSNSTSQQQQQHQHQATEILVGYSTPTPPPAAATASSSSGIGPSGLSHEITMTASVSGMPMPHPISRHRPHITSRSSQSGGSVSDSASVYSASAHSSKGGGLSSIFARRGSLLSSGVRRPRSVGSTRSSTRDDASSQSQSYEMQPVRGGHGKKHVIQNHEARMDRRKAEAAVSKWRKWIIEQPAATRQNPHPLYPPSFAREASLHSAAATPVRTPAPSIRRPTHDYGGGGGGATPGGYDNGEQAHSPPPGTPTSHQTLGLPVLDIYTTESVRMLRDVELAIDPHYFGPTGDAASPARRLSSHPRLSDRENPFANIDTLLSRRGIRPLVLELVQALGAYIDAVWCITYPSQPCPWAGVPIVLGRRASLSGKPAAAPKTWHSWTITAVQEGKRRGLLPAPSERDVVFWGWEIRYGLRDIDEAVNRRKDMGWAFGECVIRGEYGDITPANVLAGEGRGGNVARMLNDLEEALWGDAIPACTDIAFEYDTDFDPFSVFREGDELVGVDAHKLPSAREADLRAVFGDYFMPPPAGAAAGATPTSPASPGMPGSESQAQGQSHSQLQSESQAGDSHNASLLGSAGRPTSQLGGSHTAPSHSGGMPHDLPAGSPRPADGSGAVSSTGTGAALPDLDLEMALGSFQELSVEEKLELGRRRHQEYLQRTRGG